jgi:AmmeMemoRadiSam system protein B
MNLKTMEVSVSTTKHPTVAGMFYPGNKGELQQMLQELLSTVSSADFEIDAVIAPHAGYVYSGQCAADVYGKLKGKHYDRVVVLALTHRSWFPGVSIWAEGKFVTPLGEVKVDESFCSQLLDTQNRFEFEINTWNGEHSLEVHLPFLQTTLEQDFEIVPALIGDCTREQLDSFADKLKSLISLDEKKTLVVASTDFSHFFPADVAKSLDFKGKEYILNHDASGLLNACKKEETALCGAYPVYVLMQVFSHKKIEFVSYTHSGEVSGDMDRVVGYMSFLVR